ncbi:hypothetical protein MBLNU230_g3712t1 [Neophaeotheca triangularis]
MASVGRYCLSLLVDFWTFPKLGQAIAMAAILSSMIHVIRPDLELPRKHHRQSLDRKGKQSLEDFAAEVRELFERPLHRQSLLAISKEIRAEYAAKLQCPSSISMLPSYQHTLPTGREQGDFLALDVGGSTFRIALIRLQGWEEGGGGGGGSAQIMRIRAFAIDKDVRNLKGGEFFDWMAHRIGDIIAEYGSVKGKEETLAMGMAWSFPLEQTSQRSGKILPMGKGFRATDGVEGEDLGELIMESCKRQGLNVEMKSIVNDSSATLLSQAYRDPTTRISLILGTGTNAAVYLPTSALAANKFGERPDSWRAAAKHVVVNTEMSMFGRHALTFTRWDDELNTKHPLPNFQPLEYLATGRYLGEIVRLILLEAITKAELFGGEMPKSLEEPYGLDTRILAIFESDKSPTMTNAMSAWQAAHPLRSRPGLADLNFIRSISRLVSRRAAAYLASALHALWCLRTEAEGLEPGEATHVTIACNGTIVEKYPRFRSCCQEYLDDLCVLSGASKGAVTLEMAPESSILGAAVAVASMEGT